MAIFVSLLSARRKDKNSKNPFYNYDKTLLYCMEYIVYYFITRVNASLFYDQKNIIYFNIIILRVTI